MEQQEVVRLVDCSVVFDWFKPKAAAQMTITSPSGKSIVVQRSKVEKLPSELQLIVKQCVGLCLKSANNVLQLTIEQMRQLKAVDECLNAPTPAEQSVKVKPVKSRYGGSSKAEGVYNQLLQSKCKCGGKYRVATHEGWIGYYCPKCKKGGSVSTKEKTELKQNKR